MHVLLSLVAFSALAAPVPVGKEAKELAKLRGVWRLTGMTPGGVDVPEKSYTTLVVVGDKYAFPIHGGTIAIDPSKGTIDFVIQEGAVKRYTIYGIYELSGDTLKLATGNSQVPRPKDFKSAEAVSTFQRDDTVGKGQEEAILKAAMARLVVQNAFDRAKMAHSRADLARQEAERAVIQYQQARVAAEQAKLKAQGGPQPAAVPQLVPPRLPAADEDRAAEQKRIERAKQLAEILPPPAAPAGSGGGRGKGNAVRGAREIERAIVAQREILLAQAAEREKLLKLQQQILDRLDVIEKRLEAMEKKQK